MGFSFHLELFGLVFASLITIHRSVCSFDDIYFDKSFLGQPSSLEEPGQMSHCNFPYHIWLCI